MRKNSIKNTRINTEVQRELSNILRGGAKREKKCHSHQHQERKEQPIPAVPPRK